MQAYVLCRGPFLLRQCMAARPIEGRVPVDRVLERGDRDATLSQEVVHAWGGGSGTDGRAEAHLSLPSPISLMSSQTGHRLAAIWHRLAAIRRGQHASNAVPLSALDVHFDVERRLTGREVVERGDVDLVAAAALREKRLGEEARRRRQREGASRAITMGNAEDE